MMISLQKLYLNSLCKYRILTVVLQHIKLSFQICHETRKTLEVNCGKYYGNDIILLRCACPVWSRRYCWFFQ